jgi:hypothetical protein
VSETTRSMAKTRGPFTQFAPVLIISLRGVGITISGSLRHVFELVRFERAGGLPSRGAPRASVVGSRHIRNYTAFWAMLKRRPLREAYKWPTTSKR